AGIVRLVHAVPRRAAVRRASARRDRCRRRAAARSRAARDAHSASRAGAHVLRACAGRDGAAAVGAALLPRRLRAAYRGAEVSVPMTALPPLRSITVLPLRSRLSVSRSSSRCFFVARSRASQGDAAWCDGLFLEGACARRSAPPPRSITRYPLTAPSRDPEGAP